MHILFVPKMWLFFIFSQRIKFIGDVFKFILIIHTLTGTNQPTHCPPTVENSSKNRTSSPKTPTFGGNVYRNIESAGIIQLPKDLCFETICVCLYVCFAPAINMSMDTLISKCTFLLLVENMFACCGA